MFLMNLRKANDRTKKKEDENIKSCNTIPEAEAFESTFIQCKSTDLNKKVVRNIAQDVGDYQAPWWYMSHLGTMLEFGQKLGIEYETDLIDTKHSMFSLDWYPKKPIFEENKTINIIVFFPGLGLNSNNNFAQNFADHVSKKGFYCAIMGARGIDIPLKSNKFWHPGDNQDALTVIDYLYHTYHSKAKVFLVGFSAGTNILQKTLINLHQRVDITKKSDYRVRSSVKLNEISRKEISVFDPLRDHTAERLKELELLKKQTEVEVDAAVSVVQEVLKEKVVDEEREKEEKWLKTMEMVKGALCVCVNYDYLSARDRLEKTTLGAIYSFLMTLIYKGIIAKNPHVHGSVKGGKKVVDKVLWRCHFLSEYDKAAGKLVHGYETEEQVGKALSWTDTHLLPVPMVALQPKDDPLHMGQARENLCLPELLDNPNVIYIEPEKGNHFGFYEGPLLSAFSKNESYTYPAKLAVSFFKTVLQYEGKNNKAE